MDAYAGSPQMRQFQVITYNTALARAFGQDFVPCVLERLEAQKQHVLRKFKIPTVFTLQEVFYTNAYDDIKYWARKNGFHVSASTPLRNGLVTVSEYPIKKEVLHVFSCNAFGQNRGVLEISIHVEGTEVRVLNSHTQDSEGELPNDCQIQQLKEVSAIAGSGLVPSALAGDFNVGPDIKIIEQKYDPIEKLWVPFLALLGSVWQRAPSETKGLTWNTDKNPLARPGPQLNSTIDHVFVNQGLNISEFELMYESPATILNCSDYEVELGKTFMSDHFGLKAKVAVRD